MIVKPHDLQLTAFMILFLVMLFAAVVGVCYGLELIGKEIKDEQDLERQAQIQKIHKGQS